jgi:hypothetical protein
VIANETAITATKAPSRPSVKREIALLTAAVVIVSLLLCINPAPNNDLFWQLRTGSLIVHDHHAPHFDTYSWTLYGSPWVAHEWLTFTLMSLFYSAGGYVGILLWLAITVTTTFTILFRLILRQTSHTWTENATESRTPIVVAFILWIAAVSIACPFFQPRPQIFTFAWLTVTTWLIHDARRSATPTAIKRLWLLPVIFVVWANLHAGVLVGLGVTVAFAVADLLDARLRPNATSVDKKVGKRLLLIAAIGLPATLLTPYSYHEYANFAATVMNTTEMNTVGEWIALDFHTPFGHTVETYLALAIVCLGLSKRPKSITDCGFMLLLAYEALGANRNIPLLAIVGTPILAPHALSAAGRVKILGSRAAVGIAAVVAVGGASFVAGRLMAESPIRSGPMLERIALSTINYASYPKQACDFVRRERFPADMRLYNSFAEGGFITKYLPEHPVFVDSRADLYFGTLLDEVTHMRALPFDWRDKLAARGVDLILWEVSDRQAQLFMQAPDWAIVYVDRAHTAPTAKPIANTAIFVRRTPKYADLIARCRRDCPQFASFQAAYKEYPATW